MLQLFRKMFNSSLGVVLTLVFLGVIALAFVVGDVTGSGGSSASGGDKVAKVGSESLTATQLATQLRNALEVARQQNPSVTVKDMIAQGGVDDILTQMIDRSALTGFGKAHGVIAGKRLIDSELAKLPQFQNPDGSFNNTAYRQLLAQKNLTDADVRNDIAQGLVARQLLTPAALGAGLPQGAALRYAAMLKEHRTGVVGFLPAAAFAPKAAPTDAELADFYAAHKAAFTRPERRVIRYAVFDEASLKNITAPTEAEIAAAYQANAAQYAASESRKLTQLVVLGQADAAAVKAAIDKGETLEAAAKARGLTAAPLGPLTKAALTSQTSADIASAAFAAAKGGVIGPIKGPLGWAVIRVDSVEGKPARTLAQVHGDIASALTIAKRSAALSALSSQLQEDFDKGGALSDAAKQVNATLVTTAPLVADGHVYGNPQAPLAPEVAKVAQAAFAMEHEGQPQITELEAGKRYVMFDVSDIATAAPAPLAEIKPDVTAAYQMNKGAVAARAAAMKVLTEAKKGGDLAKSLAGLGVALPPIAPVNMGREQIAAQQGRVAPPILLLFSMAQGTTKLLPSQSVPGWFVVQLKTIEPGAVTAQDPAVAEVMKGLGATLGNEYEQALRVAIRNEMGVKRYPTAIAGVTRQLAGGN